MYFINECIFHLCFQQSSTVTKWWHLYSVSTVTKWWHWYSASPMQTSHTKEDSKRRWSNCEITTGEWRVHDNEGDKTVRITLSPWTLPRQHTSTYQFPANANGSAFLKDVISMLQGTVLHRHPRLAMRSHQSSWLAISPRKRSVTTKNAQTRQSLEKVWLSRHCCRQMAPLLRHNVSKQCGASDAVVATKLPDMHVMTHTHVYMTVAMSR